MLSQHGRMSEQSGTVVESFMKHWRLGACFIVGCVVGGLWTSTPSGLKDCLLQANRKQSAPAISAAKSTCHEVFQEEARARSKERNAGKPKKPKKRGGSHWYEGFPNGDWYIKSGDVCYEIGFLGSNGAFFADHNSSLRLSGQVEMRPDGALVMIVEQTNKESIVAKLTASDHSFVAKAIKGSKKSWTFHDNKYDCEVAK